MAVIPLTTVLTIYVDPVDAGKIRVSRVTAHGEEVIDVEPELAGICSHIYQQLARGGQIPTTNVRESLLEASTALTEARRLADEPLSKLGTAIGCMQEIIHRLDQIETYLQDRVLTADNTKQWLHDVVVKHMRIPPRGQ